MGHHMRGSLGSGYFRNMTKPCRFRWYGLVATKWCIQQKSRLPYLLLFNNKRHRPGADENVFKTPDYTADRVESDRKTGCPRPLNWLLRGAPGAVARRT